VWKRYDDGWVQETDVGILSLCPFFFRPLTPLLFFFFLLPPPFSSPPVFFLVSPLFFFFFPVFSFLFPSILPSDRMAMHVRR